MGSAAFLVIEAGCKSVIGQRLKMSGMFWSDRGANAIIVRYGVTGSAVRLRTTGTPSPRRMSLTDYVAPSIDSSVAILITSCP